MFVRLTLAATALFAAAASSFASPTDLTIAARDESFQRAIQSAYVQPFTAMTGIPVQQLVWDGGIDTLRAKTKAADDRWDIVVVDPDELAVACAEGLLEKLDWPAVGGKDHYQAQAFSECGLGAAVSTTVLAWDKDKLSVTPGWPDFWDVAKYPGKRGLRKGVRGNLEFALMADGVAAADVYKTLSAPEGVDRAFRKLDQLKPYIQWWSTEAEAGRILASGDVRMTTAPSDQIAMLSLRDHRNFGLQFAASLFEVESWAIAKGSPSLKTAEQFLYLAGLTSLEVRLMQRSGAGALAKGIHDAAQPELNALSPSAGANLAAGLRIDAAFWHDNLPKLRQRFDAWYGH
jgi:putative spermidine/putrescine transport system substrate-binding protein